MHGEKGGKEKRREYFFDPEFVFDCENHFEKENPGLDHTYIWGRRNNYQIISRFRG